MGAMDFEEMRPLDHLIRDRKVDITVNQLNEVYCWGTNANYNLGTGSQQTRETPELLEFLKRVSIKQVSLGTGLQQTQIVPELLESLKRVRIKQVSLGTGLQQT